MANEGDGPVGDMNVMSMIQNLFLNDSSPQRNPSMTVSVSQSQSSPSAQQQPLSNAFNSHYNDHPAKSQQSSSRGGNNNFQSQFSNNDGVGSRNLFPSYRNDSPFFSKASDATNNIHESSNPADFALNGRTCDDQDLSRHSSVNNSNNRVILTGMGGNSLNSSSSAQSRSPLPSSTYFGHQIPHIQTSEAPSFESLNQSGMSSSLLAVQNNVNSSGSPDNSSPQYNQQTFQLLNHASELLSHNNNAGSRGVIGSGQRYHSGIPGTIGQRSSSAIGDSLPGVGARVYSPIDGLAMSGSSGQINSLLKNQFMASRPEAQMEKFESQIRMISSEIHSTIQMHMNGLMSRRDHLLHQLDTIRQVYLSIIQHQSKTSKVDGSFPDAASILPNISFTKPDQALFKAVTSMGFLTTPAFAPYCTASGDGLDAAIPGQAMTFVIVTKNCFKEELLMGRENILARITAFTEPVYPGQCNHGSSRSGTLDSGLNSVSGGDLGWNTLSPNLPASSSSPCLANSSNGQMGLIEIPCHSNVIDHHNGKYTVTYSLPNPQSTPYAHVEIVILVNGVLMIGCPFRVKVRAQNRLSWRKVLSYGSEGSNVGQFCRPWGVAIAKIPSNFMMSNVTDGQSSQDSSVSPDSQGNSSKHSTMSSLSQASPSSNGSQTSPSSQTDGESSSSSHSSTNNSTGTSILPSLPSNSSTNHVHNSSNNATSGYLIAVADRSNNRVQILRMDEVISQLETIFSFGSGPGTANGQFDRPAGICLNIALGHIVVADKDNHRVQIFDLFGRFLLKFGEKGSRAGQFCYPWDVESCPTSHKLVVSDTRNRRIQLFSPYGQYLSHFSQPLDSPRGVSFFSDGKILVSDFNKHRLMVFEKSPSGVNVDHGNHNRHQGYHYFNVHHHGSSAPSTPTPPSNSTTRFIGFGEGSGWGEFLRPQGIAISGHYAFCADSRNNRICLYNTVTQTFEYLSEDMGLDRPSGIAVLNNIMIVVDFGNNRLVVCRR
jgi:hypothetical protein